ncbi:MAG: aminopeptidase-like protein [Symbiobacteriaceae bacterium]|nr:aminopeptidase-like protein [Symbiobacteriaceae bacterium]
MANDERSQRLRLLLIAGLAAPVLMSAAGWLLPFLVGRRPPNLLAPVTPWALTVGVAAGLASMSAVWLLSRIHPVLERALRRSGVKVGLDAIELAGYPLMLLIVTASAFGEEMLFRGGVQPVLGLLPAAFLFGFSHGGWRREMWAYVLAATFSGALFGLVLQLTGNMWMPIVAHVVHNSFSTILMGKKVDATWDGWLPRVRLVTDPRDFEPDDWSEPDTDTIDTEAAADDDRVDEPVLPETDGPELGPDDGDPPDRVPQ